MNNNIFRLVFSKKTGQLVPVAEITTANGKGSAAASATGVGGTPQSANVKGLLTWTLLHAATAAAFLTIPISSGTAIAADVLPTQGQVVNGNATVNVNGRVMTVQQLSQVLGVNWQSFSIGAGNTVVFQQPNAASVAVNRVIGNNRSEIFGNLQANGQVFLLNQNGVLFGKGSEVSVGGLVASAAADATRNASGQWVLSGGSNNGVINQGNIKAADGGYVVLAGGQAVNEGTITANQGAVALAAGGNVTLSLDGASLLGIKVDEVTLNALAENKGLIQADGGAVYLTAAGRDSLLNTVVNNEGLIQARSLGMKNGQVVLMAEGGDAVTTGTIDVSGQQAGEKGGAVVIGGNRVGVFGNASIDASGVVGGGRVVIGGDLRGKAKDVANMHLADNTVIAAGANIKVGSTQGDGGFVETSGQSLTMLGTVDAKSAGKNGEWLIDPTNITISTSNSIATNTSNSWAGTGTSAIVNNASIESALNSGANVTVTTNSAGTGSGDISLNANISKTAGSNASLSLVADRSITFSANTSIASSSGALDVNLTAGQSGSTASNITFNNNTVITTNGGNLTINNTAPAASAGIIFGAGGATAALVNLNVGAGTGTLTSNGATSSGVYLNSANLTLNGNVTISGTTAATGGVGIRFAGSTAESVLNIQSGTVNMNGTSTTGSAVLFSNNLNATVAAGAKLNVNGTVLGAGTGIGIAGTGIYSGGAGDTLLSAYSSANGSVGMSFSNVSAKNIQALGSGNLTLNSEIANTGTVNVYSFQGSQNFTTSGSVSMAGTTNGSSSGLAFTNASFNVLNGTLNLTGNSSSGSGLIFKGDLLANVSSGATLKATGVSSSGVGLGLTVAGTGIASSVNLTGGGNLYLNGSSATGSAMTIGLDRSFTNNGGGTLQLNADATGAGGRGISAAGGNSTFAGNLSINGNSAASTGLYVTGDWNVTQANGNLNMTLKANGTGSGVQTLGNLSFNLSNASATNIVSNAENGNAFALTIANKSLSTSGAGTLALTGSTSGNASAFNMAANYSVSASNGTSLNIMATAATAGTATNTLYGYSATTNHTISSSGGANINITASVMGGGAGSAGAFKTGSGLNMSTIGGGNITVVGTGTLLNATNVVAIDNSTFSGSGTGLISLSGSANNGGTGFTGTGDMTISGVNVSFVGNGTTRGVILSDPGGVGNNLTISSGNLSIAGTGITTAVQFTANLSANIASGSNLQVNGTASAGKGVSIYNNYKLAQAGAGNLTVNGTSTGAGSGVDFGSNASLINADGGSVSLTGTSNTGQAVYFGSGSNLSMSNGGNLTLSGTSNTSYGINFDGTANVTLNGGAVANITGSTSGSSTGISFTSAATLSLNSSSLVLNGTSASGTGLAFAGTSTVNLNNGSSILATGTVVNGTGVSFAGGTFNNNGTAPMNITGVASSSTAGTGVSLGGGNYSFSGPVNLIGTGRTYGFRTAGDANIAVANGNLTLHGTTTNGTGWSSTGNVTYNIAANANVSMIGNATANGSGVVFGSTSGFFDTALGSLGGVTLNATSANGTGLVLNNNLSVNYNLTLIGASTSATGLQIGTNVSFAADAGHSITLIGNSTTGTGLNLTAGNAGSTTITGNVSMVGITSSGSGIVVGSGSYSSAYVINTSAGQLNVSGTSDTGVGLKLSTVTLNNPDTVSFFGNSTSNTSISIAGKVNSAGNVSLALDQGNISTASGSAGFNVTGAVNVNATNGTVSLNLSNSSIGGPLNVSSGLNTTITSNGALSVPSNFNVGGALNITTTGAISNSGNISVAGVTNITSNTSDISLLGANNFTGAVNLKASNGSITANSVGNTTYSSIVSGGNVSLNGTGNITLPNISLANGNLSLGLTAGNGNVLQTANTSLNISGTTTLALGAGSAVLANSNNKLTGQLSVSSGNSVQVANNQSLNLGAVATTGNVNVSTSTGNLTLNGNIASSSGNVTLAAGTASSVAATSVLNGNVTGGDVVVGTAQSLAAGSGKTVTVYSGNANTAPLAALVSNGSFSQYKSYAKAAFTGTPDANRALNVFYRVSPVLTITGAAGVNKVYDGTNIAYITGSINGGIDNDSISSRAAAFFNDASAGANKSLNTSGSLISAITGSPTLTATGYQFGTPPVLTATISKANVVIQNVTANNKVYDTTTNSSINNQGSATVQLGDTLAADGTLSSATSFSNYTVSGTFSNATAGTGKTVNLVSALTDSTNFTVSSINTGNTTTATINKASVTISGATVNDRVYDGSTTSTVGSQGTATVQLGDASAANGSLASATVFTGYSVSSGAFADKNAGSAKSVSLTGSLTDSTNFTVSSVNGSNTTTANITKANITAITGVTLSNKVYDGTTNATFNASAATFSGKVAGDTLTLSGGTGGFASKNVGTAINVTVSNMTLGGADAGNYNVVGGTPTFNGTANITAAAVTISATAQTKTYDGTTTVGNANAYTTSGVVTGESITASLTYTDKNAGAGNKTIAVSNATAGANTSLSNYNVTLVDNTASTINKANATVSATAQTKTYDGTTTVSNASGYTTTGVVAGESITASLAYTDKNAGAANKTIAVSNATAGANTSLSNYNVSYTNNTASTIDKASLTLAAVTQTKTYDGNTNVSNTTGYTVTGLISGENVTASLAYTDKNAGAANKTIAVSNATAGANTTLSNYNVSYTNNTASSIDKASLTVAAVAQTKTYDGTLNVSNASGYTLTGLVSGESVTASLAYTDKNAGAANKTIAVNNATAGANTSLSNYNVTLVDNITSTINKANLTVAAVDQTKTYDGNTNVSNTTGYTVTGLISGENVTASLSYADKNAGAANKTIAVSNATAGVNTSLSNYNVTLVYSTASTINKANLTVAVNNDAKFVTQTDNASYNGLSSSGLVSGDTLSSALGGAPTILRTNAGTENAGTYTGALSIGNVTSSNYNLTVQSGNFTIVAADQLLVKVANTNATYGASTNLTVDSVQYMNSTNVISNLTLVTRSGNSYTYTDGVGGQATFTLGASGANVSASGNTVVGAYQLGANNVTTQNATNFNNNLTIVGALTVDKANITGVTGVTLNNKVYDGTTNASFNTSTAHLAGVVTGDNVTLTGGSASFASKNVGVAINVSVSNMTLGGADIDNYNVIGGVSSVNGTANITPATISGVTGITAANKVYDGTTNATLNTSAAVFTGKVVGDALNVSSATGAFATADPGTGKVVNVSNISLGGADASNYVLANTTAITTADITSASTSDGTLTGYLASFVSTQLPWVRDLPETQKPCVIHEANLRGLTPIKSTLVVSNLVDIVNGGISLPNNVPLFKKDVDDSSRNN